jgi:hypothetical protein
LEDTNLDYMKILNWNCGKWKECVHWIEVALDRDSLRELVKVVMNLRVP